MSTTPTGVESYIRRNLPPLLVGVAAAVAIIGGLAVVIDRITDDDDPPTQTQVLAPGSDNVERFQQLDGDLAELLERLLGGGLALGVSVTEDDGHVLVEQVIPGTPAAAAGLEAGDEIRDLNGKRVRSVEDLREAVASADPGHEYHIEIRRDGDERVLTARRETSEAALGSLLERLAEEGFGREGFRFDFDGDDRPPRERFGFRGEDQPFSGSPLQPMLGVALVQTNQGPMVVQVVPGSAAQHAGIDVDDIILAVDGRPVRTIEELRSALPTFSLNQGRPPATTAVLHLLVLRDGREIQLPVGLTLGPQVLPPPGVPRNPELPLATPGPDLRAQQLLEQLEALEAYLQSEVFIDGLEDRLGERLEAAIEEALATAASDAAEHADAPAKIDADELDVFRGVVQLLTDSQITLGGSRGAISFDLTDETVILGGSPRIGVVTTVAANAEGEAVLVLTPN